MNWRSLALAFSLASSVAPALAGCVGTTGGDLVSFDAYAAGPEDAHEGQPYSFRSGRGYDVTLTRARLHVGAVYLNRSRPTSVGADQSCQLPGIYVAQVTSGLDVDALSPALQPFPQKGFATTEHASSAEVWLFGQGDINAEDDSTVILDVAGIARKDGAEYPFDGTVTIGRNRELPSPPETPGANPICKQRIASPIPVDLAITPGQDLILRVDPAGLFSNVEFSGLEKVQGSPPLYRFHDASDDQPSIALYSGLRSSIGTYDVTWGAGP